MLPGRNYGECIEEYEVQHLLGKGGFASVYKAKCRRTYQDVAIKIIDKKLIQGSGLFNRVRQEVEIHSRLKHPSVLQLYTFFQDANYVYLVLELAHNGELQRFMSQQMSRPFTEAEAASILQQVVAGLLYLHSHQIMHRDISLSNLLVCKDMHIKIADFGLATQLKRPDEKHLTMCGTPNYISPEVVSRSSHGLPADVWSVGCMLYTLLVGRPPFDTDAVQSTLTKVVMSDPKIPAHLSFEARDLIDKLLKKSPHERISLDQVLEHPFMMKTSKNIGECNVSPAMYNSYGSGDSGIVTFASSDSKNSDKPRSLNKYLPSGQPLSQIQEDCRHYMTNPLLNNNPWSDQQYFHQQLDQNIQVNTASSSKINIMDTKSCGLLKSENSAIVSNQEHSFVPPLNTERLLPTRYKTKNVIMSILRNGEVVLEFVKFKVKLNEDRITDVCRISDDGRRIIIYQPDPGRGLPIKEHPPDPLIPSEDCVYNYDNLPPKHWKKYIYAARFVGLVKSKTPKVTYFSSQAKCHLMESMSDFEVCFYSSAKLIKSPKEGMKVYNGEGLLLSDHACNETKRLIEHGNECFAHCVNICNALETAELNGNICFPVTIGRRPIVEKRSLQHLDGLPLMRETTNLVYSTPKSQQGSVNFSLSGISLNQNENDFVNTRQSARAQVLAAQQNVPKKQINIAGIGTATELSHGIVQIQFYDGSVISVIPETQGGGITYTQSNGVSTHFADRDNLPLVVNERLAHLPQVQLKLRSAPIISGKKIEHYTLAPKPIISAPHYNRMLI